jgi:hypothetical protein
MNNLTITRQFGGFTIESNRHMFNHELEASLKFKRLIPLEAELDSVQFSVMHDREEVYWLWHVTWRTRPVPIAVAIPHLPHIKRL